MLWACALAGCRPDIAEPPPSAEGIPAEAPAADRPTDATGERDDSEDRSGRTTPSAPLTGYDLVINHGRVMDPETMLDAVLNVGIKDGKIAILTGERIAGKGSIDASGLVVAPGFIDTHFHALDALSVKMSARDGVTTGMDLEIGSFNVAEWYESRAGRWPLNYGATVSQEVSRMAVHDPDVNIKGPIDAIDILELRADSRKDGVVGWSNTVSTIEQMNEITKLLDEGLRQGALGVGSTVGYMRTGVSTYEMFEAQRAAARYGRLTSVHSRFHGLTTPPTEGSIGFDEVFANAIVLDAPLIYCHDTDHGWWENEEKLEMARQRGHDVWAEYYPYESASTTIGAEAFRPKNMAGTGYTYEKNMYDPTQDKFLSQAEYEQVVAKDPSRLIMFIIPGRDKWMPYWMRMHMTVGSDAVMSRFGRFEWSREYSEYVGHPRTAGSRGKVLRLGREQGVPLMFSLSQMSYWPAKHLGDTGLEAMRERGRLQEGMVADIVIFDPLNVRDNATAKHGEQGLPTTGMPYVIVSGQIVVKDSKFREVWAGKPIRFPVEEKGHFEPADVSKYIEDHTIPTFHVPHDDGSGRGVEQHH